MTNDLNTAARLINNMNIEEDDLKFLLLLTLCELQSHTDRVDIDPSEAFDIDDMLQSLDRDLGYDR